MAVFIDTSAIFAMLDHDDQHHEAARSGWETLASRRKLLITSNYVMVETIALVGRRLGMQAVRDIQATFVPLLQIQWVDEALHDRAVSALLTVGERHLSLVDCTSFELMRQRGLDTAFAFDAHFVRQGLKCIP